MQVGPGITESGNAAILPRQRLQFDGLSLISSPCDNAVTELPLLLQKIDLLTLQAMNKSSTLISNGFNASSLTIDL
jgi:hypothetical protein